MKKNCEVESSKKDDEKESESKKESELKKESENKKESEKKIESGKNERKTKKKKNKGVFMLRRVMSRMLFIQTSLYLYSCTKRYVLILMNLTNLCLVLLFPCCRNIRMCFLTMYLVDCHLLEE